MLASLHPAVRTWFERRFPAGPTAPQEGGWPQIAAGAHTLIAAPTGSGKTLAAFLVCIDRLYRAHEAGIDLSDGPQVVYVSPLKALAVDIRQNLETPLREIGEVAAELGLGAPGDPGGRPDRRHGRVRARRHAEAPAELPHHHPGVAVSPGHRGPEPRDAPRRPRR